jgi:hypothetical protein
MLIRKFSEFYDDFIQNKNTIEFAVFEHFQEMRFQIDQHREELKKTIDDIALSMIDDTKKHEEIYLKSLKKSLFETRSFDQTKAHEDKLNEIEETFRNPNLSIETIKEMQQKQEESLFEIQFELNQMNRVKDDLMATNYFKPNLSSFNQMETSLFGSIKFNQYSCMNSLKSGILKSEQQLLELLKLCEFSPNDSWSLLYRGTRDGFEPHDFHSKCDGHSNTLTILKAKGSEFVFGGFTSVSLDSAIIWKSDPNAFLFSLTNKDDKPLKIKCDPNEHHRAIYCHSEYGPTFGYGHDVFIGNNANTTGSSYSNLGKSYKHPQYAIGTNKADTFLAGSHKFQLDEIEVYQKE